MEQKKKFVKPQMKAIKLNTEVQVLAGSCSSYECTMVN